MILIVRCYQFLCQVLSKSLQLFLGQLVVEFVKDMLDVRKYLILLERRHTDKNDGLVTHSVLIDLHLLFDR